MEKLEFMIIPGLELRPLGRLARSQSLHRLRYRESYEASVLLNKLELKAIEIASVINIC
jgi:hypothetical protein